VPSSHRTLKSRKKRGDVVENGVCAGVGGGDGVGRGRRIKSKKEKGKKGVGWGEKKRDTTRDKEDVNL